MKLFARFFLILFFFAMLPVGALGFWMLIGRGAVRDNSRAMHLRLAALTADLAERTLEQLNRTLIVVEDVERSRGQASLEAQALRRAAAADASVALISILDAAGQETVRMGDPKPLASRAEEPVFVEARRTGRLTIGEARVEHEIASISVLHPLADGRSLYLSYSLEGLTRRLLRLSKGGAGGGRLLFTGASGRPLAGVGDMPPAPDWVLPDSAEAEGWNDRLASPSGPWVAAFVRIPALGWRAVSLQLRSEAYAESDAEATRAALFLAAICLVVGFGAYALSTRLLQPVTALMVATERIAKNDFSRPVPPLGWGELNRLGQTLNAMSEKVQRYQGLQIDMIMEDKARIDTLVRNIPGGVLLAGLDGAVLYQNATASKILRSRGDERARQVRDLIKQPQLLSLLDTVQAGKTQPEGALLEVPAAGNSKTVYLCQALRVIREAKPIGILLLMRDVTVERELEQMKEEFFHGIVHDLRGPITVIDGIVYFLQKLDTLGEKDRKYVEIAARASKQLATLVSDILDLAKLESGTMKMELARVSANDLIAPVCALYQVPADGKGVTLTALCEGTWDLLCDKPLLERVLVNLVGNSLKFTPKGGSVEIGARKVGDNAEFWVLDTGPGIPADQLSAVFEKFKQLDRDTAARAGYGLGLSICMKIVERHHGRIWVESGGEGKGSRFALSVPLAGINPLA